MCDEGPLQEWELFPDPYMELLETIRKVLFELPIDCRTQVITALSKHDPHEDWERAPSSQNQDP